MKVAINEEECVGCGTCVAIAEDVFRMNDDEKAQVYGQVTAANKDNVQEAIDTCPVSAISWKE